MAKRYIVTEKTAGWLREQMAARPGMATAGATRVDGRMGRDENGYPCPFEVCWSEAEGEWLIWLPAGIITSDHGYEGLLLGTLTGSSEYGSGWYVLDVSAGSSWTPVYLDCWGSKYDSSETSPIEYHAELVTSLSTHERLVERYVVRVADLKSESSSGAKKVKQITVGALVLKGGGTPLTASGTVVTSVDYVTSTGDPDYSAHAYSLRITRGRLTYNAATGALTVVDDPELKQFIATTPLTQEGGSV